MNFIKRGWLEFAGWIMAHKLKAVYFFAGFAAIAIFFAEIGTPFPVIMFLTLLGAFVIELVRDARFKIVILSLALILPAKAQEKPKAAGVAVGVVVVVVGGVVCYYFYNFCKRHFPAKNTNEPPALWLSADTSAAASQQWFGGYCIEPDLKSVAADETLVRGIAGTNIEAFSVLNGSQLCSREQFRADMLKEGLSLDFGTHYAINGQPCPPWQCPITFSDKADVPSVRIAGPDQVTRVIERSYDLESWTPILTNTVPAQMRTVFTDHSDSAQAFYRVRVP